MTQTDEHEGMLSPLKKVTVEKANCQLKCYPKTIQKDFPCLRPVQEAENQARFSALSCWKKPRKAPV